MIIYLSLLVAVLGALAYILAAKPETKEIGRLSFFAGLLAFLLQITPRAVDLLR